MLVGVHLQILSGVYQKEASMYQKTYLGACVEHTLRNLHRILNMLTIVNMLTIASCGSKQKVIL